MKLGDFYDIRYVNTKKMKGHDSSRLSSRTKISHNVIKCFLCIQVWL